MAEHPNEDALEKKGSGSLDTAMPDAAMNGNETNGEAPWSQVHFMTFTYYVLTLASRKGTT